MRRSVGYLALIVGLLLYIGVQSLQRFWPEALSQGGFSTDPLIASFTVLSVLLTVSGGYVLVAAWIGTAVDSTKRRQTLRNGLRLAFGLIIILATFGVITQQWVSVLFSLGIVGVAITLAVQQPLFSLVGWIYIVLRKPFEAGDRVAIDESRGDVLDVGLFVTTLWEIDGQLVSSNQPSGRVVTFPNSVVLSSHVTTIEGDGLPYVWNELSMQVSYETDIAFAKATMARVADEYLGDRMAAQVAEYREQLEDSPVDIEIQDRPSVNVVQRDSWVELRVRYLVHPRRGTRVRNQLYDDILAAFNEHPDRVKFPVGRNR